MKFFDKFTRRFALDKGTAQPFALDTPDPIVTSLLAKYGGASFGNGTFCFLQKDQIETLNRDVADVFSAGKIQHFWFGYNWMGNLFGLFSNEKERYIAMLDFGGGEIFDVAEDVPCYFENMTDLPDEDNGYINPLFLRDWEKKRGQGFARGECAGYVTPLFLGGDDDEDNLERIDAEVYWNVTIQLFKSVQRG